MPPSQDGHRRTIEVEMERLDKVSAFLEFDRARGGYVEPPVRMDAVRERLFDVIHTYNPGVIVKAGLGGGRLLIEMVENSEAYVVVVEPSLDAVNGFLERCEAPVRERVRFINGDFHDFPIDYYKADLLVCVDCLDIFDSSRSIDEFKRALQFDGILFLCTVVLENEDTDGVYDEYMRAVFPLHNDYYLEDDLKTFLELKDFRFIKGSVLKFEKNLKTQTEYFGEHFENLAGPEVFALLERHREPMGRLYAMDNELLIREPYMIGCFMRNKPS
ncbi:MAG: class I SAM-dependent methyltransferase, partial [Spirochaetales bacterium]